MTSLSLHRGRGTEAVLQKKMRCFAALFQLFQMQRRQQVNGIDQKCCRLFIAVDKPLIS